MKKLAPTDIYYLPLFLVLEILRNINNFKKLVISKAKNNSILKLCGIIYKRVKKGTLKTPFLANKEIVKYLLDD